MNKQVEKLAEMAREAAQAKATADRGAALIQALVVDKAKPEEMMLALEVAASLAIVMGWCQARHATVAEGFAGRVKEMVRTAEPLGGAEAGA